MDDSCRAGCAPSKTARGRRDPAADGGISTILVSLAEGAKGERISFGDMLDAFDARAYGPLIVLFAAPNVLPVALPGISAVLGAPLILLTGAADDRAAPAVAARASCAAGRWRGQTSRRLVARIVPRLQRIERMIRPRLLLLTGLVGKRVIGAAGMLLAAIVFLPVPFGNSLPGLALVLMAVGLLGRDGLAVMAGGLIGLVGLAVVSGFIWGMAQAALLFARHGLGF